MGMRNFIGSLRDLADRSCDRRIIGYTGYDMSNAIFMLAAARALESKVGKERYVYFAKGKAAD
jgi:hypothetical protein